MTYTALYRRFRPGTFASLIGQEHVGKTLAAACRRSSLAHAYLFCGPRGTGKTSAARILARAVCCLNPAADGEPCGTCAACQRITNGESLDVHEIDAASNRGIDDIRELRDRVRYAAAVEKYKVYIIDEVHMLSAEAFNALLKTLEEPPPGVLFVLATTEPHKVPVTIMSRCQRFDFRRIGEDDIRQHLLDIAAQEGLQLDAAAAELIARRADGGMRDAISLLDQCAGCAAGAPIDARTVSQVLGVVDADFLAAAADNLLSGDMASLLARVDELNRAGADNRQFLYSLLEYIRQLLLLRLSHQEDGLSAAARELPLPRLLAILQCFGDADGRLKFSAQPRITLELALIKACSLAAGDDGRIPQKGAVKTAPAVNAAAAKPQAQPAEPRREQAPAPQSTPVGYVPKPAPKPQPKPQPSLTPPVKPAEPQRPQPAPVVPEAAPVAAEPAAADIETIRERWDDILKAVERANAGTAAYLRMARPLSVKGSNLLLEFSPQHQFHMTTLLGKPQQKQLVQETVLRICGCNLSISGTLGTESEPPPPPPEPADPADSGQMSLF